MEVAFGVHVAIGWSVQFGGVGFQRMGGELFDPDLYRRCQPLRCQVIEPGTTAVRIGQQGQSVLGSGLVAGHQWNTVLDGGGPA